MQDALRYGSSSAPATEQRHGGSRSNSMQGGRLRASSGERGKVGHAVLIPWQQCAVQHMTLAA
jgi:hypothetical protein